MSDPKLTRPDLLELCPGQQYTIEASGQRQPILEYTWEVLSTPAGAQLTFVSTDENSAVVEASAKGLYKVRYCYTSPRVA